MLSSPSIVLALLLLSSALTLAGTKTYFRPDDDTQQVMLDFASSAQKSILIADYSFTCAPLTDILVKKHAAGVDVRLVLDKTEAAGKAEKVQLAKLMAAGVSFEVGTSQRHRAMHLKVMIVDGISVISRAATRVVGGRWCGFVGSAQYSSLLLVFNHDYTVPILDRAVIIILIIGHPDGGGLIGTIHDIRFNLGQGICFGLRRTFAYAADSDRLLGNLPLGFWCLR